MTSQEIKTKEALRYLGFNKIQEVSKRELDFSYKALSDRYKNNIEAKLKLDEYYEYLSDIRRTNETIRNILDPNNKTYMYQDEIPESEIRKNIIDNNNENINNNTVNENINDNANFSFDNINDAVRVADKPSALNIVLSLLIPLYGILEFILLRKILPKAAKWYLVCAIIGEVISFVLMFYLVL